ncbi:hypothetical protein cce_0075 [Crocosphaera subtropica ATCC 51142]|uniref:Uncharacterized protein n=1 Tax=Crocosphaera subtropica (strain ATCC 51142 / BH68) TaxID=43989 RepID=B1WZ61_CROS5|nr:hypothetical protein cce_0075 [Crocosphaera subtropica ATCC 51142]
MRYSNHLKTLALGLWFQNSDTYKSSKNLKNNLKSS